MTETDAAYVLSAMSEEWRSEWRAWRKKKISKVFEDVRHNNVRTGGVMPGQNDMIRKSHNKK